MARQLRNAVAGGWYHVMNRGIDRKDVFFGDSDRIEFGERLAYVSEMYEVEIHAYCLMDNHYHLVVVVRAAPSPRPCSTSGRCTPAM